MALYEKSLELFGTWLLDNSRGDCPSKFIKALLTGSYKRNYRGVLKKQYYKINDIKILFKVLKETNSIIAGGSVLAGFTDFNINDIDIYVNVKNVVKVVEALIKLGYILNYSCLAPPYDQSFFKKNNILSRLNFVYKYSDKEYLKFPVDLMIIPDNIQVENVPQNFDLSFCEIWFDGQNIYAVEPNGINNKKGFLKPDYNKSLFQYFNKFIINRIKKYVKRGFNITYSTNIGCPSFFGPVKKEVKEVKIPNGTISAVNEKTGETVYPEEWVVKKIYEKFIKEQCGSDILNYACFILTNFTVQNLFKMLQYYYNIYSGDIWFLNEITNNIYEVIPDENQDNIEETHGLVSLKYLEKNENRERFGTFFGDLKPEFVQKRINKKIKLLIKHYLFHDDLYKNIYSSDWILYFNNVLNFDINNEDEDDNEKFYIDMVNYEPENFINSKMLSEIIFISDLNDFSESSVIEFTRTTDPNTNETINSSNIYSIPIHEPDNRINIVKNYYKLINSRSYEQIEEFNLIPSDLKIFNEDFEQIGMFEYLNQDDNNIIFIWNSDATENTLGGFKGIGLTKDDINKFTNISIECTTQIERGAVYLNNIKPLEDNLFNVMRVGDSLNNGIYLKYLNNIKDLARINKCRIFYLTDINYFKYVANVKNIFYPNSDTNLLGYYINVTSGAHCSDGTGTYVYNKFYTVDLDKLIPYEKLKSNKITIHNIQPPTLIELFPGINKEILDFIFEERIIDDRFVTRRSKRGRNITRLDQEENVVPSLSLDVLNNMNEDTIEEDLAPRRLSFEQEDLVPRRRLDFEEEDLAPRRRLDFEEENSLYTNTNLESSDEDESNYEDLSEDEDRINILSNIIVPIDDEYSNLSDEE